MDVFQKILDCKEEEVDSIIEGAINDANLNAEKVKKLGFLDYGKSCSVFRGFIPLKTRIKYATLNMEDYGMGKDILFIKKRSWAHWTRSMLCNVLSLDSTRETITFLII